MGWAKSYTMWCDCCDTVVNSADLGDSTLDEAKRTARANGARITGKNRVICESCWDEGAR